MISNKKIISKLFFRTDLSTTIYITESFKSLPTSMAVWQSKVDFTNTLFDRYLELL